MTNRVDRELAVAACQALEGVTIDEKRMTRLRALPLLLHNSGLAAACAYQMSLRDGSAQIDTLLRDAGDFVGLDVSPSKSATEILKELLADNDRYRLAEKRARMFAMWLVRIAGSRVNESKRVEP